MFNGFKHMVVPIFGLLANFACMLFYLIGPWTVAGMSVKEPYIALRRGGRVGRLRLGLLCREQQGAGQGDDPDGAARSLI